MSNYKEIAIIGPTASGKSALAIKIAHLCNAVVLSIDSLAVYKGMDIVSAKPTLQEQDGIAHFGIDLLDVDQHFSANMVADLYQEAKDFAISHHKNLVIVGGSSFYLKSLLTGLSTLPEFSFTTLAQVKKLLNDLPKAYTMLLDLDPQSMKAIDPNDRYRIEKLLLLYVQTQLPPSLYFKQNPSKKIIETLPIFEIEISREALRERINQRTALMMTSGLIDEIAHLESKYPRNLAPMKAIGVIETLQYLDNMITLTQLQELIATHTMQLAKRQSTFNKTQFDNVIRASKEALLPLIEHTFNI